MNRWLNKEYYTCRKHLTISILSKWAYTVDTLKKVHKDAWLWGHAGMKSALFTQFRLKH